MAIKVGELFKKYVIVNTWVIKIRTTKDCYEVYSNIIISKLYTWSFYFTIYRTFVKSWSIKRHQREFSKIHLICFSELYITLILDYSYKKKCSKNSMYLFWRTTETNHLMFKCYQISFIIFIYSSISKFTQAQKSLDECKLKKCFRWYYWNFYRCFIDWVDL
jgi:hypothetical protein